MLSKLLTRLHKLIDQHRLGVLTREIVPALRAGERVLDVGCGNGTLGVALMNDPACPKGVVVEGLERAPRGGEPIKVHRYDGRVMPMADGSYGVVIVADLPRHEREPGNLLRECSRVSDRVVISKDHRVAGFFSQWRVSLMDWAANAPYGVPCLFRCSNLAQWRVVPVAMGGVMEREITTMDLCPGLWNPVFGRGLQYMAFIRTDGQADRIAQSTAS